MKQASKPDKKAKNSKSNVRIHRRISEREFLKRVAKDPESVFTDFDVKYAVKVLRDWCRFPIYVGRKSNGVRILKKAGLNAYIPKTSRGILKVYRENPDRLLSEVKLQASKLKQVLPKRAKSDNEKLQVIRMLIDSKATLKSIGRYFPSKSLSDYTNIALAWFAYDNGVSFYTVLKLYEKLKKNRSKVDTPSWLDDYNDAYIDYVFKEQLEPSFGAVRIESI